MTNKEQMQRYLKLVEGTSARLADINQVIHAEVTRRYGHRIEKGKTPQERKNLLKHFTIKVTRENQWHADVAGDRNLYIQLAQMYGIAAMLDEAEDPS